MRPAVLAILACFALVKPATAAEEPSCRAVTKAKEGPRNVGYRLRCDFSIDRVDIRTSRPLTRVRRRPLIDSERSQDRLVCGQRSRKGARCRGDLSVGARVRGGFAVEGSPCDGLVTTFEIQGGACTDDVICIQIAYFDRIRVEQPRGC